MTIARKVLSAGAIAGLSAVLAGCMSGGGGGSPTRPAQTGIEGSWIDAQGTGLSTLSGGVFTTVATDTGQKLAEGSYVASGATSVQINGTSLQLVQIQLKFLDVYLLIHNPSKHDN